MTSPPYAQGVRTLTELDRLVSSARTPCGKGIGDFEEVFLDVIVDTHHLVNEETGILSVFGQALHHGTKERLGKAGSTVQSLLHGQCPRALCPLHLVPQLFEEHGVHLGIISRLA